MTIIVDALRHVTSRVQRELDEGLRSPKIDANDVVQILLAVADEVDPPFGHPDDPHDPRED